jgi:stearoyl-CoA desaturase (delta-9 desaturase)
MINSFFTMTPVKFRIVGAISTAMLAYALYQGGSAAHWALAVALYFLYGCLGIAVTFHRYLTHNSFKMSIWKERVFAFFGHLAGTGSAISWVAEHINHHKFSDTSRDPHSPKNGALNMWMLNYKTSEKTRSKTVFRMLRDPFYRILHKYFLALHIVWVLALYALFGLNGVIFGHFVPVAFVFLGSAAANFFGHTYGMQRYATSDDSRNNPLLAFFSWGEGWHNNHHRFPGRPNFGEKWWELDVSWRVIRLIKS